MKELDRRLYLIENSIYNNIIDELQSLLYYNNAYINDNYSIRDEQLIEYYLYEVREYINIVLDDYKLLDLIFSIENEGYLLNTTIEDIKSFEYKLSNNIQYINSFKDIFITKSNKADILLNNIERFKVYSVYKILGKYIKIQLYEDYMEDLELFNSL